ncbi:PAS domain-containing protein [Lactobacillus intestinalis]|uniref:PAS domain-containing protein n=1 Tax=Lactobacillus intestinalis TaxID=151781 RepID=UPI0002CB545B|nr:PAS domain-containing protein [Lactobacillus intestinalis]KAI4308912.1 hypothetical protein C821_000583 [Lactobacillus intestinalis]
MVNSKDIGIKREKNLLETLQFLIDGGDYSKGSSFLEKAKRYQAAACMVPGHPLYTFRQENDQITNLIQNEILPQLKIWQQDGKDSAALAKLQNGVDRLHDLKNHYSRKEISIYPLLVKNGLASEEQTSKLWQMDDDVRDLVKKVASVIRQNPMPDKYFIEALVEKMAYQVLRLVFQEEAVCMPLLEDVVSTKDWHIVKQDEIEVGYCLIDTPPRWDPTKEEIEENQLYLDQKSDLNKQIVQAFHKYVSQLSHIDTNIKSSDILKGDESYPIGDSNTGPSLIVPNMKDIVVKLEVGSLSLKEIPAIFNVLPIDLTFVDAHDRVKWFSNSDRVFPRTRSVIGRPVIRCHPPKSIDKVLKILDDFHKGYSDSEDFWVNVRGRIIYLSFFAVRDAQDNYLGCLETVQDITKFKNIAGTKTLENKEKFDKKLE